MHRAFVSMAGCRDFLLSIAADQMFDAGDLFRVFCARTNPRLGPVLRRDTGAHHDSSEAMEHLKESIASSISRPQQKAKRYE